MSNLQDTHESHLIFDSYAVLKYIQENRKGRQLEDPKSMKGAPDSLRGFGYKLHGQEEAGRTLAEYLDKVYPLVRSRDMVKENFKLPVYVHGVGCGKSVLLSHALDLIKEHCKNDDLKELLKEENHPLAIHISFSSMTPYVHDDEKTIVFALIRRILASCLDLKWDVACKLQLGGSLRVEGCLEAIMTYHKSVNGMRDDQQLFVYLGVDEINQLVRPDGPTKASSLKELTTQVKCLMVSNGFVSTLLSGTHLVDVSQCFLGSGIGPLQLPLTRLSEEAMNSILRTDVGVSQKYFDDPQFQKLLRDIGCVMRAIGITIETLEYEYNPESIVNARNAVKEYFQRCRKELSEEEVHVLYDLVLTGRTVYPRDPLVEGSHNTFDSLQNAGTIVLVPSSPKNCHPMVFMSRVMLESFFQCYGSPIVDSAEKLLAFIDANEPDLLETFVAHYHGLKKRIFLRSSSPFRTISVSDFYSGALIGEELLKQAIQLIPATVSSDFPDGVMSLQGKSSLGTKKLSVDHLAHGGVVLNSKEGAIDVLACEKFGDLDSYGARDRQKSLIVYATKHATLGDEMLTYDDVTQGYDRAVKALSECKKLSNATKLTVVHFSNRELSKEVSKLKTWQPEWRRSVVVGRSNIEYVVGPMFGRMLLAKSFHGVQQTRKIHAMVNLILRKIR